MTTYVSNRNAGTTDEQGHYRFQTKVWQGNVLSGLLPTENSPLARNVLVPIGDLKIDYGQYAFTAWNDATVTVAIATADTTNPRIDRIIAYVDLAVALGTTNNPGVLKFISVAGTPAGSPAKASDATVNAAVGASNPWCEIATVRVEANATTIPNSKITDTRTLIYLQDNVVATNAIRDLAVTAAKLAGAIPNTKLLTQIGFSGYKVTGQAVGNTTDIVLLDGEEYDLGNNFDTVTHPGRFTAPVTGLYQVGWCVAAITAGAAYYVSSLVKNGVAIKDGNGGIQGAGTGTQNFPGITELILAAGDYLEIAWTNTSGANKSIVISARSTYFYGSLKSLT